MKSRVGLLESDWFPAEALALIDFKMLHSAYSDEQTMDVSNAIRALRRFKEADELELLMTCMAAGDAGHASARKTITPGVSELDVYRAVQDAAVTKAGRLWPFTETFEQQMRKRLKQADCQRTMS